MSLRTAANRLKVKKLYILGAGASYGASLGKNKVTATTSPLDKDFCSQLLRLKETQRPKWVSESIQRISKNWKQHLDFDRCGLEEAIIIKIGNLNFLDSIHKRKVTDYNQENFLNDISHCICHLLKASKENKSFSFYKKITKEFFEDEGSITENQNRIISFNYDTMLDEHFLGPKKVKPQRLYFDKIRNSKDKAANRRYLKESNPILLKLHGSENWACETSDFKEVIIKPQKEKRLQLIDKVWIIKKTPSPDDDLSPCIIPPLPTKPITQISLFHYLWSRAYEYLHEAEEIIICGYSLPQTDNLATSLFSTFKNKRLKKVKIIDPDPNILKKWKTLLNRRGVEPANWEYYTDFNDYFSRSNK